MKLFRLILFIFTSVSAKAQVQVVPPIYQSQVKSTSDFKNQDIDHSKVVWYQGDTILINQKIVLLNPNSANYKNNGRNAAIERIKEKFANKKIPIGSIIVKKTCLCDSNLILLEGPDLHKVTIRPDPDGTSADNNNHLGRTDAGYKSSPFNTLSTPFPSNYYREKPIDIAYLDTGIDPSSPLSLSHMFYKNGDRSIWGLNFTNPNLDNNINDDSPNHHGTTVANILAHYPQNIKIWPLKIIKNGVGNLFDAVCALLYAYHQDIPVINCSWGHRGDKNDVLDHVIRLLRSKETIVIASAGNENKNIDVYSPVQNNPKSQTITHYPAMFAHNYRNVISVTTLTPLHSGNYDTDFVSLGVKDLNTYSGFSEALRDSVIRHTSYAAAFTTALFLSKYRVIRTEWGYRMINSSSTEPAIKRLFYNQDDMIEIGTGGASGTRVNNGKIIRPNARVHP